MFVRLIGGGVGAEGEGRRARMCCRILYQIFGISSQIIVICVIDRASF